LAVLGLSSVFRPVPTLSLVMGEAHLGEIEGEGFEALSDGNEGKVCLILVLRAVPPMLHGVRQAT
jgi:hypothetical protein